MKAEFITELYECVEEALLSLGDSIKDLGFFCTEEQAMVEEQQKEAA